MAITKNKHNLYLDKGSRLRKNNRSREYHELPYVPTTDMWMVGRGPVTNESCGSFHSAFKHETENLYIVKKLRCNHLACPECYSEAISSRVFSSTVKLKLFARQCQNLIFQHVSFNFMEKDVTLENFYGWWNSKGRKKYNDIAKKCGLSGGIVILHVWVISKNKQKLIFRPHIHVLGHGYLMPSMDFKKQFGFVYVQHKKRFITQLDATFAYLLNHAAMLRGKQTIRHFGLVSNNKYPVVREMRVVKFPFRKVMTEGMDHAIKTEKQDGNEYFLGIKSEFKDCALGGWYQIGLMKVSHGKFAVSQTVRLMLHSADNEPVEYVFRRNGQIMPAEMYDKENEKKLLNRNLFPYTVLSWISSK